jgi:hypothetical protein
MYKKSFTRLLPLVVALGGGSCFSDAPAYLAATPDGDGPEVRFDVFHKPFPEIPLPNDFATRYDASSPTKRRLNASIVAGPTKWEQATRRELDKLSGWGTLAPITVSFSEPIDPEVILARHGNDLFDYQDDAVLVIDVTPGSPTRCEAVPLDLGQGNYPQVLAQTSTYESDPRDGLSTLVFEEVEEDVNGNGVLDPGEDTDMDGVLDHPNTRDGKAGSPVLDFYERETNTLILKPVMPMREATTYAVVLTRRLTSPSGKPIRSPFDGINHAAQTDALGALPDCLPKYGLGLGDIGFTWSFTTQKISEDYVKVRDGLYGLGPLASLSKDFPAELSRLDDVRDPGPDVTNPKLVPVDVFLPLALQLLQLTGSSQAEQDVFAASMASVDFIVAGAIESPQLFQRKDDKGAMLPLYEQVWDLEAKPRAEEVPFWMFVPKNRKGPAPVAMFIHGHGGSKFDALPFAGLLASYGIATMGIDAPGHGIGLDPGQLVLVRAAFQGAGLEALGNALLNGRAIDWNADGKLDPGDDYWSAYVFHTRDMVRQTMLDGMQVVRTLRGFDGKAKWSFGPAGSPGIAGDFDGDGQVDVGGTAPLHVLGGSLGGITGGVFAGVEPQIDTAIAIVPGGMLSEIGTRSTLGGVRDAMVLRALGPIFFADSGKLMLRTNDGQTSDVALEIADLPEMAPQDTVVLGNLTTGEYRCGAVQASGTFRVAVSSDAGDPLRLRLFKGPLSPREREGCEIPKDAPYAELTSFGYEVTLGEQTFAAGSKLVAPTDGFGLRRATPDLRRFLGLSQVALEAADPMNWAPYWSGSRTLKYGTGEVTRTNVMMMPSVGDPGVLIAAGCAMGRAAGFIGYDRADDRYGKSQNQVLLDTHTIEGTVRLANYTNSMGEPVLMDVDHLAAVVPVDDGLDVPRLDPPLRLMHQNPDGSWSGFILPMLSIPRASTASSAPIPRRPSISAPTCSTSQGVIWRRAGASSRGTSARRSRIARGRRRRSSDRLVHRFAVGRAAVAAHRVAVVAGLARVEDPVAAARDRAIRAARRGLVEGDERHGGGEVERHDGAVAVDEAEGVDPFEERGLDVDLPAPRERDAAERAAVGVAVEVPVAHRARRRVHGKLRQLVVGDGDHHPRRQAREALLHVGFRLHEAGGVLIDAVLGDEADHAGGEVAVEVELAGAERFEAGVAARGRVRVEGRDVAVAIHRVHDARERALAEQDGGDTRVRRAGVALLHTLVHEAVSAFGEEAA